MSHPWVAHYPQAAKEKLDVTKHSCIASVLAHSCHKFAERPAITCLGKTLTYEQWDEQASYFASYLQNVLGLKKGDRLAIMLPNIHQFPVAFYGAQKVGITCVNTNPLYTPREMQHQFKDSGAKALVISDLFLDKLQKILPETDIQHIISANLGDYLPSWKSFLVNSVLKVKKAIPKHDLTVTPFLTALEEGSRQSYNQVDINLDDVCVLQYTGGTTGVAKGATLTQGNVVANVEQVRLWISSVFTDEQETVLTALPLYHIFALTCNLLSLQSLGQHSILVPRPVPIENTVKIFKKYPITIMTGVNTLFNALNNDEEFKKLAPKIKLAVGGGAAVQQSVAESFKKITGAYIVEGYGLTEASPVTHINPLDGRAPVGSIGVPVPETVAKVFNEKGEEVPVGEEGELCVQGPQVMRGYWNRPDETAKTIRDGWLWTGDMAKQDKDGYFYIVDRKKDMILVSGFNVYPNEVESILAQHPKVMEAAVVGVPDQKSGEAVKAFVVRKDDSLTETELRDYLSEVLTGYKRPKVYEFRPELPKTNVGKILRRELRNERNDSTQA